MNKIVKRFLLMVFLFSPACVFAQTGSRVYESNGNFSYCPPLGWTVREFPGLKYKVVIGGNEGGFAPNINFVDELFDGNLREYVDISISQFPEYFMEYRLLSRNAFKTNSGIAGERIIIANVQNRFSLKQIFYIFQASQNKYIVVTCSVTDSVSEKYLSVFDESIKTFELIN